MGAACNSRVHDVPPATSKGPEGVPTKEVQQVIVGHDDVDGKQMINEYKVFVLLWQPHH